MKKSSVENGGDNKKQEKSKQSKVSFFTSAQEKIEQFKQESTKKFDSMPPNVQDEILRVIQIGFE